MSTNYWNIVSDFAGVRFALDVVALVRCVRKERLAKATQPLALAFEVEQRASALKLRMNAFDLLFFDESEQQLPLDALLVCAHLRRNGASADGANRVFVAK